MRTSRLVSVFVLGVVFTFGVLAFIPQGVSACGGTMGGSCKEASAQEQPSRAQTWREWLSDLGLILFG